jgi:hypothetical protein
MGIRGRFADSRPSAATRIRLSAWKPAGTFIVYRRPPAPRDGEEGQEEEEEEEEGGWRTFMRAGDPIPPPRPIRPARSIGSSQIGVLPLKGGLINKSAAIGGVPNRLPRLSAPLPPRAEHEI